GLLDSASRLATRGVGVGWPQFFQQLSVVLVEGRGLDLDGDDLLLALGLDRHHAPARRGLHLLLGDLLLDGRHLLLEPLSLPHQVAEAFHWPSPSGGRRRTATTSPSSSATTARTAG